MKQSHFSRRQTPVFQAGINKANRKLMRNSTEVKQIKDFNSDLKSVEIMLQPQPETRHVRLDTIGGSSQSRCNSFEASSTNSSAKKPSVVTKQKAQHNLSLLSKRLSNQQDIERAEDDERQQLCMIKIPLRVVEESAIDYRLATNAQTVKFLGACNPT